MLSDLNVHGEVLGLANRPDGDQLGGLLTTCLDARQRAAVEAVCTDMHRPYVNAVAHQLPISGDPCSISSQSVLCSHALRQAYSDDVRRSGPFFRCSVPSCGPIWSRQALVAVATSWKTVRGSKRGELAQLFAANRRLPKAYVLRDGN